ncbi:TPA: hypothetical protein DEP21_03615 [Patescibacteria group bacterium]|nr:hypothetical protein [Candidatus Gracilibacteria bacterium]
MKQIKKHEDLIILILIGLNILLIAYIAFCKKDALSLETLKVGGKENFRLVQDLYNNEAYKNQQTTAIQQAVSSFAQQD